MTQNGSSDHSEAGVFEAAPIVSPGTANLLPDTGSPSTSGHVAAAAAAPGSMGSGLYPQNAYMPYNMSSMMFMPHSPMWYAAQGHPALVASGMPGSDDNMAATTSMAMPAFSHQTAMGMPSAFMMGSPPELSANKHPDAARIASRLVTLLKQEDASTRANTVLDAHKMERLLQRAMSSDPNERQEEDGDDSEPPASPPAGEP